MVVVATDVTALRDNEQRLTALNDALGTESARNLANYRETPAMLLACRHDGEIIEVSERFLARLGYERGDLIGQKLSKFFAHNFRSPTSAVKKTWKDTHLVPLDTHLKGKDGHAIHVETQGLLDAHNDDDTRGLLIFSDLLQRTGQGLTCLCHRFKPIHQNPSLRF